MSKITQALEKAARERLLRERESSTIVIGRPSVSLVQPPPMSVPGTVNETVRSKVDPHIVPFFDRRSVISEQYRMLRTNLQSLKASQGFRTLLITSAMHNEGKTVSALNLALTLSQQPDCNVLLIDADLRKAAVERWLGFEPRPGLSEVLANGLTPQQALVRLESTMLTILPAGAVLAEPSERLDSFKMRELIQQFKRQFDYVLVDSPPLLQVTDPSVLSRCVDGVLMVVRAGKTQRRELLEAYLKLEQVKARVAGTILTHAGYYSPASYYYHEARQANGRQDAESVSVALS